MSGSEHCLAVPLGEKKGGDAVQVEKSSARPMRGVPALSLSSSLAVKEEGKEKNAKPLSKIWQRSILGSESWKHTLYCEVLCIYYGAYSCAIL